MIPASPQILHHVSEHGRWEVARCEPSPPLRLYVRSYQGFVEDTTSFVRRREMPTGDVNLLLPFGRAAVWVHEPRGPVEYTRAFVAGVDDAFSITETGGAWRGVQVSFTPVGAYLFFGLPMSEIARRVVDFEALSGPSGGCLTERLEDMPSWGACFEALDRAISKRLEATHAPALEIIWAWRQLSETHGRLRIAQLSGELGWSRKRLVARFREQVGVAPKVLARVLRFQRALRLLDLPAPVDWADVAQVCGYYDQAHLIRDFRQLAGDPPERFLRRRLPAGGGVLGDGDRAVAGPPGGEKKKGRHPRGAG